MEPLELRPGSRALLTPMRVCGLSEDTWSSWLGLLGLAWRRATGFQLVDDKLEVSHWKLRRVSE